MHSIDTRLVTPEGFRSVRVGQFMWQLDEQRRALRSLVSGADRDELGWQPAPGMNTIGMLLAHVAYAEAHLGQVGLLSESHGHAQDVIGFTEQEEGLPLAPGAPPSPAFDGKDLGYFEAALDAARAHTRRIAAELEDADLEREVHRTRPDGTQRVFNVAWVFYHLLEHESGHRGQIALLRHLYRERQVLGEGARG